MRPTPPSKVADLTKTNRPLSAHVGLSDLQREYHKVNVLTCAWATHFDTFWTNLWLEGLASGTTYGIKKVSGARLLLPFPHYYPRGGHQFFHHNATSVSATRNPSLSGLYTA